MNLRKLFIPTGNTKAIDELESYTVEWCYKTGWSDAVNVKYKVFINKTEAEEFKQSLEEAAKLIGCYIKTLLKTN